MIKSITTEQQDDFLSYSRALFAEKYGASHEALLVQIRKTLNFSGARLTEREGAFVQRSYRELSDLQIGKYLRIPTEIIKSYRLRHSLLVEDEWSEERIILYLRMLQNRHWVLTSEVTQKWHKELHAAIRNRFGAYSDALKAANISADTHLNLFDSIKKRFPTPESILPSLKNLCEQSTFPTFGYILKADEKLLRAVLVHWGSLAMAGFSAGIKIGRLDARIARLQGDYCESLIKEALKEIGRNISYNPQKNFRPDAFDVSTNKFIEVKLSIHNFDIEKTLEAYQSEFGSFELWYLRENKIFLSQLEEKFPLIKFFSVQSLFPDLVRLGRGDLVDELKTLDRNELSSEFLKYIPRHSSAESYERIQNNSKDEGVIGGHKPDFFCFFLEDDIEVKKNNLKTVTELNIHPRLKGKSYLDFRHKMISPLLKKICELNKEWLLSETQTSDPVLIDLTDFVSKLGLPQEKQEGTYARYKDFCYKVTFCVDGRVYYPPVSGKMSCELISKIWGRV